MRTGTVLELNKKEVIVFTKNSKFIAIKSKDGMYIGQQIVFDKSDIIPAKKDKVRYAFYSVACIILIVVGYYLYSLPNLATSGKVYAILELESSDRLTLKIDKDGNILDGVIKGKKEKVIIPKKSNESIVIKKYLNNLVKNNEKEDRILVISSSLYNSKDSSNRGELESIIGKTKNIIGGFSEKLKYVEFIELTSSERIKAEKHNLSLAKYYAYLEHKKSKDSIQLDQASNLSIKGAYSKSVMNISNWETGIFYKIDNKVNYNNKKYICLNNHVSQDDWTPDKAVSLWKEITGNEPATGDNGTKTDGTKTDGNNDNQNQNSEKTWKARTNYKVNDEVVYKNITFICLQAHKSQEDWTPDRTPALWKKKPEKSINNTGTYNGWAADTEYKTGDKVIYNGKVYSCLQSHNSIVTWEPDKAVSLWKLD